MRPDLADANNTFKVHVLDMGAEKYGDSIVCEISNKRILVDGGHKGDIGSREGYPSIPDQLSEILNQSPPFDFDLLVVTHCHSDHIGCLPELVSRRLIRADWALVADEKLGFGRAEHEDSLTSRERSLTAKQRAVVAAMREESRADLKDEGAIQEFLQDAATVEDRYVDLLQDLKSAGTKVVRYGRNSVTELLSDFASVGLQLIGPTRDHLVVCADAIASFTNDVIDAVEELGSDANPVRTYIALSQSGLADAVDRPGKGAAINDQSIVLSFTFNEKTVLLLGDMQLAKAEVTGLEELMDELCKKVESGAPYDVVKLSHHTSYNGLDERVMKAYRSATVLVHSGGINDATHPDIETLSLIKATARVAEFSFARTDRNGLISIDMTGADVLLEKSRGRLNDFTSNADVLALPTAGSAVARSSVEASQSRSELPHPREMEQTTRIEHTAEKLVITIESHPVSQRVITTRTFEPLDRLRAQQPTPFRSTVSKLNLAGGRTLPSLLFVTNADQLSKNIGLSEAKMILETLKAAGHTVVESVAGRDALDTARSMTRYLKKEKKGVVILGGYDVVPAIRLDVLPKQLRSKISTAEDADNFIVWNDEFYGDVEGDGLPELPVSRIPDGKTAALMFAALQSAGIRNLRERFGIRNRERPFADEIFNQVVGNSSCLVSEPTGPETLPNADADTSSWYFMLHGADDDASRFWGEDDNGVVEAFRLVNIASQVRGIVFTGCCWGALPSIHTAWECRDGRGPGTRTADDSIALRFLSSGASAFVGCTGSHYSPVVKPYNYFGGPLHEAFWKHAVAGTPPAEALFRAKIDYISGMPHGRKSAVGQAIELKLVRQFTCLGLGW